MYTAWNKNQGHNNKIAKPCLEIQGKDAFQYRPVEKLWCKIKTLIILLVY